MKNIFPVIIACLFCLTSCSLDNISNDTIPTQPVTHQWHLTQSSGGFTGVDNPFDLVTVIWVFDPENGTISITNNNTDDTKEDAFVSGTYTYEVLDIDSKSYLIIEGDEFGEIAIISNDKLTIDQNQTSTGSAADLYIYTFDRKLINTNVTIN